VRDWPARALALLEGGEPAALITILAAEGSTPREAGTRMIVTPSAAIGTIGGGNLEHQAIRQARALLTHAPGDWRVQDYPLGPLLAQCCGGRVRLLLEHLTAEDRGWLQATRQGPTRLETVFGEGRLLRFPSPLVGEGGAFSRSEREDEGLRRPLGPELAADAEPPAQPLIPPGLRPGAPLLPQGEKVSARGPFPQPGDRFVEHIRQLHETVLLFGAGHVGQALAKALGALPFGLSWLDSRPEAAEVRGVALATENDLVAQAAMADADSRILIMTHDHGLDYRLTAAALSSSAGFVGLIGSKTKKARFISRLRRDGFDEAARARLVCPIGLPGVIGKEPEVIAIAVAAQLLTLRGGAD